MTSADILEHTLQQLSLPVAYYDYQGTKKEYVVYNEEAEEPVNYGDNCPQNRVVWWQVHIFAPKESGFRAYKKDVEKYLLEAGFFITDIVTLFEKETATIHVVISCHMGERKE